MYTVYLICTMYSCCMPVPHERRTLSRDIIGRRALAIADADGVAAVTVRRVAKECSVTPMALYAHFADKTALLSAVSELVLEEVRLPPMTDGDWREQLADVIRATMDALDAHPAVVPTMMATVLSAASGMAIAERVLELLSVAGFSAESAGEASRHLLSAVVGVVSGAAATDHSAGPRPVLTVELAAKFPHVAASFASLTQCTDKQADRDVAVRRLVAALGSDAA